MSGANRATLAAVALFGLLVGSCSRERTLPLYGYTSIRTPFLDRFAM